jgi:hypothetical protein
MDNSVPSAVHDLSGQRFPSRGVLANSMDTPLAVLRGTIPNALQQSPVFVYIVTSVKVRNGRNGAAFVQTGSGPNFQGGYISLCTCKHKDRASPPPLGCRGTTNPNDPWEGVWVAGLCSPSKDRPRGLFYLMLVGQTFASHAACWHGLSHPLEKSAHRDSFGDIYEPLPGGKSSPWSATSYMAHLKGHCHDPAGRNKDIEASYYGRHPRLLIGDPKLSFLLSAPHITLTPAWDNDWRTAHHRFFPQLSSFLETLQ